MKETSVYWNLERKHDISLCGEIAVEEAVDLL
jgi:hypothetical protein